MGRGGQEGFVEEEEKYQKRINLKMEGGRGIQKRSGRTLSMVLLPPPSPTQMLLGTEKQVQVDTHPQLHTTLLLAEAEVAHAVSLLSLRKTHMVCDKFF